MTNVQHRYLEWKKDVLAVLLPCLVLMVKSSLRVRYAGREEDEWRQPNATRER